MNASSLMSSRRSSSLNRAASRSISASFVIRRTAGEGFSFNASIRFRLAHLGTFCSFRPMSRMCRFSALSASAFRNLRARNVIYQLHYTRFFFVVHWIMLLRFGARSISMDGLLSVQEAAKRLGGISKWTVHAWLSKGKLQRTKVGGRTMIRESELAKVIEDGGKSPVPPRAM